MTSHLKGVFNVDNITKMVLLPPIYISICLLQIDLATLYLLTVLLN